MIVKNALNLAGLLDFVLRKSQGGWNQTLTIVSLGKKNQGWLLLLNIIQAATACCSSM